MMTATTSVKQAARPDRVAGEAADTEADTA